MTYKIIIIIIAIITFQFMFCTPYSTVIAVLLFSYYLPHTNTSNYKHTHTNTLMTDFTCLRNGNRGV